MGFSERIVFCFFVCFCFLFFIADNILCVIRYNMHVPSFEL